VQVLCNNFNILHKGFEKTWILRPMGKVLEPNPPWISGECTSKHRHLFSLPSIHFSFLDKKKLLAFSTLLL
jgi:hypothetical protein